MESVESFDKRIQNVEENTETRMASLEKTVKDLQNLISQKFDENEPKVGPASSNNVAPLALPAPPPPSQGRKNIFVFFFVAKSNLDYLNWLVSNGNF